MGPLANCSPVSAKGLLILEQIPPLSFYSPFYRLLRFRREWDLPGLPFWGRFGIRLTSVSSGALRGPFDFNILQVHSRIRIVITAFYVFMHICLKFTFMIIPSSIRRAGLSSKLMKYALSVAKKGVKPFCTLA